MNENDMAGQNWMPVCEDEPRVQRAGRDGTADREYFTRQSIAEFVRGGVASNLMARDYKDGRDLVVEGKQKRRYIVRRLTPTECARLQGFPDWWTDGANGTDSAKYKMWGNGIALPCAEDVLGRIAKAVEEEENK